ncbi:MAG: diaminopimelate decarboxylase [Alphaproteobacteria bacterium]|nr:diaminopimelate decarboxylase [Alphaproteobacteria bacterium]
MSDFVYKSGRLHAEGVDLARIAETVGTPVYVYAASGIERRYREYADALAGTDAMVCYAMKANDNQAVLSLLKKLGAGADTVSEGEIRRALAAGFDPKKIVYSGVGKSADEMAFALSAGIGEFNVESDHEVELLADVARQMGKRAKIAVRINPDVDPKTHAKITTGKKGNKFGIDFDQAMGVFKRAAAHQSLDPVGVASHIGSQITSLDPYRAAFGRMVDLVKALRAEDIAINVLDVGGGLGVGYTGEDPPSVADYVKVARAAAAEVGCKLVLEPGRRIVAESGVLLTRVLFVKEGTAKTFVIVDGAMNDLIRPTLYEAYHPIVPVKEPAPGAAKRPVDVVGPICESGDFFAKERDLAPVGAGDILAITHAGAYGAVMASSYNARRLTPEVLVRGQQFSVVRPRPSYEELIGRDRVPDWL